MVSLVMTTYNGKKFILEQLKSILAQTCTPDEVIIVDDCSTDDTVSLIRQFIKHNNLNWKLFVNSKNLGFQKNFIYAISLSKGDLIFLADQDDIWKSNKIEIMIDIMNSYPYILSLSSSYLLCDQSGKIIKQSRKRKKGDDILKPIPFEHFLLNRAYPGMSMVIRRSCYEESKIALDINYIAHDWLFNIVAAAHGQMYYYSHPFVLYRQHENNTIGVPARLPVNINTRIAYLTTSLYHFQQADAIISKLSIDRYRKEGLHKYIKKQELIHQLRIENLENRRVIGSIFMIRFIKYYKKNTAYLGDIYYSLRQLFNYITERR